MAYILFRFIVALMVIAVAPVATPAPVSTYAVVAIDTPAGQQKVEESTAGSTFSGAFSAYRRSSAAATAAMDNSNPLPSVALHSWGIAEPLFISPNRDDFYLVTSSSYPEFQHTFLLLAPPADAGDTYLNWKFTMDGMLSPISSGALVTTFSDPVSGREVGVINVYQRPEIITGRVALPPGVQSMITWDTFLAVEANDGGTYDLTARLEFSSDAQPVSNTPEPAYSGVVMLVLLTLTVFRVVNNRNTCVPRELHHSKSRK